jgi:predicted RNase H-like HicB family nuclease
MNTIRLIAPGVPDRSSGSIERERRVRLNTCARSREQSTFDRHARKSETINGSESKFMRNEFTGVIERDGEWFIAYCPEIPGANGQGKTKEEALRSLSEAIALILEDRREEGLRGVPPGAIRETVTVQ